MDQHWDLLVLDDLQAPSAIAIGLRLWQERKIPFFMFPSCGEHAVSSMEQRSMGIYLNNELQKMFFLNLKLQGKNIILKYIAGNILDFLKSFF